LQVLAGDGAGLGQCGAGQGVVSQSVDFPGYALGGLEQRFDGERLEQRQLAASQAQAMGEILGQLVTGQICIAGGLSTGVYKLIGAPSWCSAALEMALTQRRPAPVLIHHSDRGSQYASHAYQQRLARAVLVCSMSRRANCYDNAVMESFYASLKTELIYREDYPTRVRAKRAVFEYVECFYNRQRLHSTLGYLTPVEKEAMAEN
jgi:hypothetical protein